MCFVLLLCLNKKAPSCLSKPHNYFKFTQLSSIYQLWSQSCMHISAPKVKWKSLVSHPHHSFPPHSSFLLISSCLILSPFIFSHLPFIFCFVLHLVISSCLLLSPLVISSCCLLSLSDLIASSYLALSLLVSCSFFSSFHLILSHNISILFSPLVLECIHLSLLSSIISCVGLSSPLVLTHHLILTPCLLACLFSTFPQLILVFPF